MEAEWKQSIDTEDFMLKVIPSLEEHQIQKYIKEIGRIWERFEVRSQGQSWMVLRSHNDIQEFIIEYNFKFKAKLIFGSFMMQGITEVCRNTQAIQWPILLNFLEVSDLQMSKVKSMKMQKKSGGRYKDYFCCRLPWQWQTRNFIITNSGVLYYSQSSKTPKQYMPFGNSFKLLKGLDETDHQFGIRLEGSHRKLLLYAPKVTDFFQFIYFIQQAQGKAVYALGHRYRYDSFAPVRTNNNVQFMVDGQRYFRAVAEALQRAQWQILMCGWWVSPEFQLVRPVNLNKQMRLDLCLKAAADRGVKIFVLVYNESTFLTNDSTYTKQALQSLSSNIKVLQHPLGVLPTFWSHHEKAVIVDQSEGLMGGLDLCYGRYDTSSHRINHNDQHFYPGIEYNNNRRADFVKVRQFWNDSISRNNPRLPWHDVTLKIVGQSVMDLCHHFIQYWNYASFQTHYQDRYVLVLQSDKPKQPLMKVIQQRISKQFNNFKQFAGSLKKKIFNSGPGEGQEGAGSNEENGVPDVKEDDIHVVFKFDETESSKSKRPPNRMKEDDQVSLTSNKPPQNKDDKHQLERIPKLNQKRHPRFSSIIQIDTIVEQMEDSVDEDIDFMNQIPVSKNKLSLEQIHEEENDYHCQVLRSVGGWSIGCDPSLREKSIHTAYIDLIQNAKHFIYIENQFFISAIEGTSVVKNDIANAIFKRIERAHLQKQAFKVFVILPLVPGFAGQLDDPQAIVPRMIMHWQITSIVKSQGSLLRRIAALRINPSQYINFYGLRTYGQIVGRAQTEIIYIHSKMMIVDDCELICGSANINDRSMRGNRDSELCMLVGGGQKVSRLIGGEVRKVTKSIHELRLQLFSEHFGGDINAEDPLNQTFMNLIQQRTRTNTDLYRQIFHCYPDDNVRTLAEISKLRSYKINQEFYVKNKDQIIGHAVQYPLHFLQDEDLLEGATIYPNALSV